MQTEQITQHRPSITFLNMTGDITISWDEQNRDAILALVEQKMKSGHRFFIIKPRALGLLGNKKVPLTQLDQAAKAGSIVVPDDVARDILNEAKEVPKRAKLDDDAVETVVASGKAQLTVVQGGKQTQYETQGVAKKAEQVLQNQTVAVRPIVGG